MAGKRTRVVGIGINDADYKIAHRVNGKLVLCPIYAVWSGMIRRCYDIKSHAKRPNYSACSVAKEWHFFSKFKEWMEKQDWKGKHLDKDILIKDNKSYSPEACVFVDAMTNGFILERGNDRGDWPLGVHWCSYEKFFKAQCNNPFSKKRECIGRFTCPESAHSAWKKRKHELACELSKLQTNDAVAIALRTRYI